MDKFIASENIKHFKDELAKETDARRRSLLAKLIAEEEAKLAEALANEKNESNS